MAAAYTTGDYTMQKIATCFGVHNAIVSRAVKRAEQNNAWLQDLNLPQFNGYF